MRFVDHERRLRGPTSAECYDRLVEAGPRSFLLGCALLGACGPSVGASDASSGEATSTGAATTGSTATTTTNGDADEATTFPTDESTSASEESTTGAPLDCAAQDPTRGCSEGCMDVWAYRALDDEIAAVNGIWLCVAAGDALAEGYRSTWWSDESGELLFLLAGTHCGVPITTTPTGWTECSGARGEPSACNSVCTQGVCPGESDAATLQGCGLENLCTNRDSCECLLTAWRDRVPGRYEFSVGFDAYPGWQATDWVVVVDATGAVQATNDHGSQGECTSPLTGIWGAAQSCELADPQVFDELLAADDPCAPLGAPSEELLEAAFVGCIETPAICP
jgi:hypothetical protein